MKNGIDDLDDTVQQPPSKRIKLEDDPIENERFLSEKRPRKGGRKSKSTIEERALELLNDDRISAVEPQQVLCRMCGHWVKLFKHTDFSPANWRTHADKCETRSGWKARLRADPGTALSLTIPSVNPSHELPAPESISAPPAPATIASSSTTPKPETDSARDDDDDMSDDDPNEPLEVDAMLLPQKRTTRTNEDRRRELESDKRCENPGPHSVFCKMCGQWVRLHNTREYDLWNWLRHAEKCEVRNGWVRMESNGVQVTNVASKTTGDTASPVAESPRSDKLESPSDPSRQGTRELRRRTSFPQRLVPGASRAERETAPAASETVRPTRSRTLTRAAETRKEDPELSVHRSEEPPTAVEGSASVKRKGKGPSRPTPIIKPEPNGSDDFLFYSPPGLKIEGGVSSAGLKRKKGRTAEERKQALLSDPRAGQVLPNEVFCNMCRKWIKLYKEVDYVESNWVRHAERCSLRVAAKTAPKETMFVPVASTSASSSSPVKRSPMKTDHERLHDLKADPRIEAIEPQQVLCRVCKQWIKLQSYRNYDIWNWRKHIPLCEQRHSSVNEGSSRLIGLKAQPPGHKRSLRSIKAEEVEDEPAVTAPPVFSSTGKLKDETSAGERRAILERDGRCENIEPQRVTCKLCRRVVGLHVKKDYSLSNWYKHIASCDKGTGHSAISSTKAPVTLIDITQPISAPIQDSAPTQAAPDVGPSDGSKNVEEEPTTKRDKEVQPVLSAPPHVNKLSKSNPAERRAKLLADGRVEAVEPNRIKCKLCQCWLKLNEFMEYAPYNWYKHVERCEARMGLRHRGTAKALIVVKEEEIEAPAIQRVEEPSISSDMTLRKRTTAEERLARLRADPRIKVIEKHRAQCGLCEKWVKLQHKTEYDPHNWIAHITKCAEKADAPRAEQTIVPLSAETRETSLSPMVVDDSDSPTTQITGNPTIIRRRTLLLNDIRTVVVEPHRVLCGICNQWIKLRDGKDYVPYNWFKHKRKCEKRHGFAQSSVPPIEDVSNPAPIVKMEPDPSDLMIHSNGQRKVSDEEREARLRADPRLGGVEPGRVFCKMCDSWIRLNMATGYLPGNWIRHAQRCKGRMNWQGATPESMEEPPELSSLEVIDLETDGAVGGHFGYIELGRLIGKFEPTISSTDYGNPSEARRQSAVAPTATKQPPSTWNVPTLRARPGNSRLNSPAPTPSLHESRMHDGKRMHRTEEARKQELESDPRTKVVHPEKILCRMCDRWIQMRRDVSYSPQNWLKHAGICEQRTGWVKKQKTEDEDENKPVLSVVENVTEELMPYNARKRLEEKNVDFEPPPLKPVDWKQFVDSDDEDDYGLPNTVNTASASGKLFAPSVFEQAPMGRLEPPNGTPTAASVPKMSVPSPSAPLRANKADLKANASSASTGMDMKRPVVPSPPIMPSPFTTVPLPFYRTPYAPHMVQHGFPLTKDGVPTKSSSPPGSQRSLPFVVPAPSMLPHLLPRPVLVPISHTSRHAPRTVSPFSLPGTPPIPSVGLARTNGAPYMHSLVHPQGVATPNRYGGSHTGTSANSVRTRLPEANGVAVPVPMKPVLANGSIPTESSVENPLLSPRGSAHGISPHGARDKASTVELLEGAFQSKPAPDVLQLGPRVDLPGAIKKASEKRKNEVSVVVSTVPSGKSVLPAKPVPGVLQLAPGPEEPARNDSEKQEKADGASEAEADAKTAEERLDVSEGSLTTSLSKQDAILVDV